MSEARFITLCVGLWPFDLWVSACQGPIMCTKFGVDSWNCFRFTARTRRHTDTQTHSHRCHCSPSARIGYRRLASVCDRASIHPYDGHQTITSREHPRQKWPSRSEPNTRPSRSEHVITRSDRRTTNKLAADAIDAVAAAGVGQITLRAVRQERQLRKAQQQGCIPAMLRCR